MKISFRTLIGIIANTVVFLVTGCVEPYLPPPITIDHNYLVIEGFLVGNDSSFITLSRTQIIGNPASHEVELQALVEVEGENGTKYTLSKKGNGQYVAPPLDLEPSIKYRLHIRTQETKEYLSDYVSLKSSHILDSVTWKEDYIGQTINFNIFAHDPENKTHYYFWTYDETWEYTSAGISIYYYENGQVLPRKLATELNRCWKTNSKTNIFLHSTTALSEDVVHDFPLFSIRETSRKLYFGYSILVKQYGLSREAYDYWTQIKKTSESLGGLFDPLPSQALSNIRCVSNPGEPVIGHFSYTTASKKRIFFNRQEIIGPSTPYDPTGYEDCQVDIIPPDEISEVTLRGKLIHDRTYDLITQEFLGYIALPEECLDCRYRGGVLVRPDYWH